MLKYECDNCGQEVYVVEAVGQGVYVPPNQVGKPYVYVHEGSGIQVSIQLSMEGTESQFCYACMWRALKWLLAMYGPDTTIIEVPNDAEDSGTGDVSDIRLHELHAEGHLPETGPDSDPEDDDGPAYGET